MGSAAVAIAKKGYAFVVGNDAGQVVRRRAAEETGPAYKRTLERQAAVDFDPVLGFRVGAV
jgi:hypothetical protein